MKAVSASRPAVHRHEHRHTAPGQHEHEFEPQYGLPEKLPADEKLLWQGAPDWKALAVQRFHVRKVSVYFGALLAARLAALLSDGMPLGAALFGTLTLSVVAVAGVGLLSFMAWLTARTTVYTLTDKRVVMRIGIALTLALNLPLKRMSGAAMAPLGAGRGDIALRLFGNDRIAYFQLWPHARRWCFSKPEPVLLCLPDAQVVAELLAQAWRDATGEPVVAESAPLVASTAVPRGPTAPVLATR
jgi:hypothetical protein